MSNKITPQLEYPLNDYQLEALLRLSESLPDMETVTGRFSSDAVIGDIPRKGNSTFFEQAMRAARIQAEWESKVFPASLPTIANRYMDELSIVCDELPFTSKEATPFCRSVRVWDAKGFSPAVELCNRHPDLLVADDWLRATTFDLYCMVIKTSKLFLWDVKNIFALHGWVKYLKEVQAYEFSDTVAPAKVYYGYRLENDMRGLFKRRSNDDSPKRQYINLVINWRARAGRV